MNLIGHKFNKKIYIYKNTNAFMPAYILVKCLYTLLTSLLFPIISNKSSSPTK